jgi:hypothetical protein
VISVGNLDKSFSGGWVFDCNLACAVTVDPLASYIELGRNRR